MTRQSTLSPSICSLTANARLVCIGLISVWCLSGCDARAQPQRKRPRQRDNRAPMQQLQQINAMPNVFGNEVRGGQAVIAAPAHTIHEPFSGPMSADKIRQAIDDAVLYLRSRQAPDGAIEDGYRRGGATSLAALTMLAAGSDPASDESLRRALDWLLALDVNDTYVRAVRANVWEYALRKSPYDKRYYKALEADFHWLLKALGDKEGWRYQMESTDWDNSVTQYGVLGIWAACRAGFDPGHQFWQRMSQHFRSVQNEDGGWGYQRSGSSANMATAGLATMFLVFDMYHGQSYYTAKNPRPFSTGPAAECLASIERGMEWLGKRTQGKESCYYLYGIERAGVASGRKYFGGEDWFQRGAMAALQRQGRGGEIQFEYGPIISTAFSTLFLVYGGAPVVFNKLEYGTDQSWNLNPRDLANLTKHLWSAYERPLNWHSVSIDASADELEAPILFISGNQDPDFDEAAVARLRAYVERGGTILAEPSDHSAAFRDAIARLVRQMYPKAAYPSYKLLPLPSTHSVYSVLKQAWHDRPLLYGVSDGSRTFLFVSEGYMSADWQMNRRDSDAFKLAMNLLFYATDLGGLAAKYHSTLPSSPPAEPEDANVRLARARLTSLGPRPRDWEAGGQSWAVFAPYFKHVTGGQLDIVSPVGLTPDALAQLGDVDLLHLTGRDAVALTDAERRTLESYVANGGTVLIDAYAGAEDFASAARDAVENIFGELSRLDDAHALAAGRFLGGSDLSRGIRFTLPARRRLRARGDKTSGQKLEVAYLGDRAAVIFSAYDVTAALAGIANFGGAGYKPASARKLAANIVAYARSAGGARGR